jgi:H+/Na+-translocating ferredoxin:NAD+ oxidoreductase subunit C
LSGAVRLPTFPNGVHPGENKGRTEHLPLERMPFVKRYTIPVGQHIGAPARPIVSKWQPVERGDMIAEPGGFVSTAYHSPVSGTVVDIGLRRGANGLFGLAIEIEADPYSTQCLAPRPAIDVDGLSRKEFVSHVQRSGMVGLGGAAFPSHVKYAVPEDKVVEHFVLNGCECEPYLTCDHRVMVEHVDAVVRGTEIVAAKIGARAADIGVESNKMDAVSALRKAVAGRAIDVHALTVKYPQGAEKMLIKALFGLEVPAGKLPLDLGMIVNNTGTMASIADYFDRGIPLIERVVTVSGPAVRRPANVITPIGTPVRALLERCGGLHTDTREVIMGGPMMGITVADIDAPVLKGTSGILAFTETETAWPKEYTCIRCARCLEACPLFLNPSRLGKLSRAARHDEALEYHAMDCMECGACSYACPSAIPLVHLIRVSKQSIRERSARERSAAAKGPGA